MGNKLRATVSASAIAFGIAISSQAARAADPMEQAYGPDWYISVFGGASFSSAQLAYNTSQYEIKLKDGFSVGAAIGRQLGNGFRAESELSYMTNSNKKERNDGGSYDSPMDGDTAAVFLLGNLWKDFRLSGSVQPYVGAGLGTAFVMFDETDQYNVDDTGVALAGQMGAGVRVALSDRLALDVGYRLKAAIDASFHSIDGDDNSVFSYYSHTAQLGLSYAIGDDSSIMPAVSGDPSDWYVSMFAGGVQTQSNLMYDDGENNFTKHKLGFTLGGAVGTHLAPGLRSELELSYARSALKSYSTDDGSSDPAGGHLEQGFLLANIWKDFDAGMLTPYIGGGIGFGLSHYDNANFDGDVASDDTGLGFAGQFGFGARMAVSDNMSVDLGYRYKSIVDALIIGGNDFTFNGDLAATNHVVQLGLNYGLGAGQGDGSSSGVPDSRYVSLFGGLVLPVDTHANYNDYDYLVSFKNGFTLGAAVGQNLTETLRGEIEVSMQSYDVDDVDEEGSSSTGAGGNIDSYFLMANMWRDMEIGGFKPYVGGGVGMGLMDIQIDYSTGSGVDSTNLALAAQVGSGVRFDVSDNLTVDVGYRFKAVNAVVTEGNDGDQHNTSSYFTHAAQIGVSWKF